MGTSRQVGCLGTVLEIQRMSTEDGPGLRTTAFLKGCPLSCAWCHNPEGIHPRPELQWVGSRCISASSPDGCGACLRACPRGALAKGPGGAIIVARGRAGQDGPVCDGCGACVEACPAGAMELLGRPMTAEGLVAELLKDRAWFAHSDRGGITLSGGEASAQPGFALEVLRLCRREGIHSAIDTCGVAAWESLEELLLESDLVLWDLKEADPIRHLSFTGLDNGLVFDNFRRLGDLMRRRNRPAALWLRSPVIPGATDREENFLALGRLVAEVAPPRLERWELCAFNKLCRDKYLRLGLDWAYADSPLMSALDMARLAAAARLGSGGKVEVSWTGSTRLEGERN
jgi:pyruvate formate lyase activating enzyme